MDTIVRVLLKEEVNKQTLLLSTDSIAVVHGWQGLLYCTVALDFLASIVVLVKSLDYF